MKELVPIPRTLTVVQDCWIRAENSLQRVVLEKYHDLGEAVLTVLFHREFSFYLENANKDELVGRAFMDDLSNAFPALATGLSMTHWPSRLVAEVFLHNPRTEGRTGGDFGLTFLRPNFSESWPNPGSLILESHVGGLLCQAKLGKKGKRQNGFTPNQRKNLKERLAFLGILLYSYTDLEGHNLRPFQWKLGDPNISIQDTHKWLTREWHPGEGVPGEKSSSEVLEGLANGTIGTDDQSVISDLIKVDRRAHLEVKLSWSADQCPPSEVRVNQTADADVGQVVNGYHD